MLSQVNHLNRCRLWLYNQFPPHLQLFLRSLVWGPLAICNNVFIYLYLLNGAMNRSEYRSVVSEYKRVALEHWPIASVYWIIKQTPWPESASKLYRPRDRHLLAKRVPTFTKLLYSNGNIEFRQQRISSFIIFLWQWWLDAAPYSAVQGKFNYSGNKSWLQEVNRSNIRRFSTRVEIAPNFVLDLYLCMFNYRVWGTR
jgi:hypothetical protein